MHTEVLSYEADRLLMQSHLYFEGDAAGRPGILVFPEAFGLSQHAKTQAERLAGLGYITLACDLHGQDKLCADLKSVIGIPDGLSTQPAPIQPPPHAALH